MYPTVDHGFDRCKIRKLQNNDDVMSIAHRVFSGLQPTGALHLGNYFGAVRRWICPDAGSGLDSLTQRDQRLFSVVDLHAITMPQNPSSLRQSVRSTAATLLGCGLDHRTCVLFQQSRVPEHAELGWILGCLCSLSQLSGQAQYKEKSAKLKDSPPLGLLAYPVLQAADILLYKATHVPVGEDNLQNVQVSTSLARAFNRRFESNFFPYPQSVVLDETTNRVRSLRAPEKKMSKSDTDWKGCIYLSDPPETVLEKCRKAVTDFTGEVTFDPKGRPGVSNLVSIHCAFTGQSVEEVCSEVKGLNTGQYKLVLAEVINEKLKPIREKTEYYEKERGYLDSILDEGAEIARDLAVQTMKQVRELVGFS